MCTAIQELMEESRMEGREEGHLEGREEGRMQGRMEGRMEGHIGGLTEGRAEGERMMANLILKLTPDTDEYKIALLGTSEEREGLYKKYGIMK